MRVVYPNVFRRKQDAQIWGEDSRVVGSGELVSVGQKQPFLVSSRRLYCYMRRGRTHWKESTHQI
jgi:hypothetical protein